MQGRPVNNGYKMTISDVLRMEPTWTIVNLYVTEHVNTSRHRAEVLD